jgi:hypothetical protein
MSYRRPSLYPPQPPPSCIKRSPEGPTGPAGTEGTTIAYGQMTRTSSQSIAGGGTLIVFTSTLLYNMTSPGASLLSLVAGATYAISFQCQLLAGGITLTLLYNGTPISPDVQIGNIVSALPYSGGLDFVYTAAIDGTFSVQGSASGGVTLTQATLVVVRLS